MNFFSISRTILSKETYFWESELFFGTFENSCTAFVDFVEINAGTNQLHAI